MTISFLYSQSQHFF